MGLEVTISVHQSDAVAFDDVAAMNAELDGSNIGQLIDASNIEYWTRPQSELQGFVKFENGRVTFANTCENEFSGYSSDRVQIYGCMGGAEMAIIASHMTAGKLVLRKEIEGNETEYYILTPNSVDKKTHNDIRF